MHAPEVSPVGRDAEPSTGVVARSMSVVDAVGSVILMDVGTTLSWSDFWQGGGVGEYLPQTS